MAFFLLATDQVGFLLAVAKAGRRHREKQTQISSWMSRVTHLFSQTAGVLQQVVHPVRRLLLLRHSGVLAGQGKVGQNVDHDLGEAVGQQLSPVLLHVAGDGLDLLEIVPAHQVRDQNLVGGASGERRRSDIWNSFIVYNGQHTYKETENLF